MSDIRCQTSENSRLLSVVCGLLIVVCCLLTVDSSAQDIHFSQYNSSPLTLNPALTGFYSGDYRLTANYRSQWGSISDSYRTIATSAEFTMLKGKLQHDHLAIGFQFFNDKAGEIEMGTNSVAFSAAYRKALGRKHDNALTFGVQTGVLMQKLNMDKVIFDSQYNGVTVDPSQPSGENISGRSNAALDLTVGLIYHTSPMDNFTLYFGGSYAHLLEPNISFLSGSSYKLNAKYVGHIGSRIETGGLLNFLPSAVYYQQGGARQINAGTYFQFVLNDDDWEELTAFSIGAWARVANPKPDAFIIGARLDYFNFVLSLTYDVNISDLSTVSESRGAYEISVIYTGTRITRGQRNKMMPCPQL
ncbi:MAG: PorP/SprF family type IX secretion system membrane protein [Chitinophagales bacterium]|nr:PorP/SprF family type IX secretion system membrane protein [Chitinophagales bacterium]